MLNSVDLEVYNKKVHYTLHLSRRVTVIYGDSGTGKTYLRDLVDEKIFNPGVTVKCKIPAYAAPSNVLDIDSWLISMKECVLVVDEGSSLIKNTYFFDKVLDYPIWVIIMSRDVRNVQVSHSVKSIYRIKTSGKYKTLVPMYDLSITPFKFNIVLTEDFKSGKKLFERAGFSVKSSHGNTNVHDKLEELGDRNTLVVVDGANFGRFYKTLLPLLKEDVKVFMPESIEEFMLRSPLAMRNDAVKLAIENPEEGFANDVKTWERFYTHVMEMFYYDTCGKSYSKGTLPRCLVEECCFKNDPCAIGDEYSTDKIREMFKANGVE